MDRTSGLSGRHQVPSSGEGCTSGMRACALRVAMSSCRSWGSPDRAGQGWGWRPTSHLPPSHSSQGSEEPGGDTSFPRPLSLLLICEPSRWALAALAASTRHLSLPCPPPGPMSWQTNSKTPKQGQLAPASSLQQPLSGALHSSSPPTLPPNGGEAPALSASRPLHQALLQAPPPAPTDRHRALHPSGSSSVATPTPKLDTNTSGQAAAAGSSDTLGAGPGGLGLTSPPEGSDDAHTQVENFRPLPKAPGDLPLDSELGEGPPGGDDVPPAPAAPTGVLRPDVLLLTQPEPVSPGRWRLPSSAANQHAPPRAPPLLRVCPEAPGPESPEEACPAGSHGGWECS